MARLSPAKQLFEKKSGKLAIQKPANAITTPPQLKNLLLNWEVWSEDHLFLNNSIAIVGNETIRVVMIDQSNLDWEGAPKVLGRGTFVSILGKFSKKTIYVLVEVLINCAMDCSINATKRSSQQNIPILKKLE